MNKIVPVLSGVVLALMIIIAILFERTLNLKGKLESKETMIEALNAGIEAQNKALKKIKIDNENYIKNLSKNKQSIQQQIRSIPKVDVRDCEKTLEYVINLARLKNE